MVGRPTSRRGFGLFLATCTPSETNARVARIGTYPQNGVQVVANAQKALTRHLCTSRQKPCQQSDTRTGRLTGHRFTSVVELCLLRREKVLVEWLSELGVGHGLACWPVYTQRHSSPVKPELPAAIN